MFWVILVYFNIRNTLPKSGTFLLGHSVYPLFLADGQQLTAGRHITLRSGGQAISDEDSYTSLKRREMPGINITDNMKFNLDFTTDPALQSVGMSFLSGNLSVLSGSRGTLYTTQHSRYYELYYFTSYISLFSLTLQNYWIYIWMHL